MKIVRTLWQDEHGFVLSAELILVATVLVLAMVVGLAAVAHSVNNEMSDMAGAVDAMHNNGVGSSGNWQNTDVQPDFDQSN